jgi:hypothetical protein
MLSGNQGPIRLFEDGEKVTFQRADCQERVDTWHVFGRMHKRRTQLCGARHPFV